MGDVGVASGWMGWVDGWMDGGVAACGIGFGRMSEWMCGRNKGEQTGLVDEFI